MPDLTASKFTGNKKGDDMFHRPAVLIVQSKARFDSHLPIGHCVVFDVPPGFHNLAPANISNAFGRFFTALFTASSMLFGDDPTNPIFS